MFDHVARLLSGPLHDLTETLSCPPQDIVITFPPRRHAAIRKDGFDQAKRLAEALSRTTGWPTCTLLTRTEQGRREQKRLNAEARAANAASAYALSTQVSRAKGKTVILIDDLYTTGATLQVCAALLLSAGANRVILATVGKTEEAQSEK